MNILKIEQVGEENTLKEVALIPGTTNLVTETQTFTFHSMTTTGNAYKCIDDMGKNVIVWPSEVKDAYLRTTSSLSKEEFNTAMSKVEETDLEFKQNIDKLEQQGKDLDEEVKVTSKELIKSQTEPREHKSKNKQWADKIDAQPTITDSDKMLLKLLLQKGIEGAQKIIDSL